jgi:hypothetical protein
MRDQGGCRIPIEDHFEDVLEMVPIGSGAQRNHVSPNKLAMAERPAGLAFSALLYLGRKGVTPSVVDKICHKLSTEELEALKSCRKPAWLSDVFFKHSGPSSTRV